MVKIDKLYYLTEVAKYNSINKAAESLYITKAAVSNSIKQLERQCGYPILERTYRGVRLTKNGERAVKIAEQVLSLCDEIERLGNEKVKKKEKYNLILTRGISKLLSKHLVGPSSKVLQYFKLEERYINLEDICERLSSHTIALVMVARKEIEIMKKRKTLRVQNYIVQKCTL